MNVTVKLFGQLIDIFQKEEMEFLIAEGTTLSEVFQNEIASNTHVDLPQISAAVNNRISPFETELKDGDRIDLMPPFAGG